VCLYQKPSGNFFGYANILLRIAFFMYNTDTWSIKFVLRVLYKHMQSDTTDYFDVLLKFLLAVAFIIIMRRLIASHQSTTGGNETTNIDKVSTAINGAIGGAISGMTGQIFGGLGGQILGGALSSIAGGLF
jgi:hypothetical protein